MKTIHLPHIYAYVSLQHSPYFHTISLKLKWKKLYNFIFSVIQKYKSYPNVSYPNESFLNAIRLSCLKLQTIPTACECLGGLTSYTGLGVEHGLAFS